MAAAEVAEVEATAMVARLEVKVLVVQAAVVVQAALEITLQVEMA